MDATDALQSRRRIKHQFSKEEDEQLIRLVQQFGDNAWPEIEKHMGGKLARQCRERWRAYLSVPHGNDPWTPEEDDLLLSLFDLYGSQWTFIARSFPARGASNVKNRQNLLERRAKKGTFPPRPTVNLASLFRDHFPPCDGRTQLSPISGPSGVAPPLPQPHAQ
jgi:hypothetical protein